MRSESPAKPFTIDNVYPWGRSLDEYRRMFDLSETDLRTRIVSVADGPASFNAEMTQIGGRVVSCDPLYEFSADDIRSRVESTRHVLVQMAAKNAERFVWDRIRSPEALGDLRRQAAITFIDDFDRGKLEQRYVADALPTLALADDAFDVSLCSHFLFLYADEFSLAFHVASVAEMIRIARDVRIFPLLDMRGEPSPHVEPVMQKFRDRGLHVERRKVNYEFQRGGNEMLRITRATH